MIFQHEILINFKSGKIKTHEKPYAHVVSLI